MTNTIKTKHLKTFSGDRVISPICLRLLIALINDFFDFVTRAIVGITIIYWVIKKIVFVQRVSNILPPLLRKILAATLSF